MGRAALLLLLSSLATPAEALAEESRGGVGYPAIVGDGVDPRGRGYWPVRVQRLDEVRWTLREGRNVGMAAPTVDGLLLLQGGGGTIRGVDARTGESRWATPGNTTYWNYSTCVVGPGGIAYGGNFHWIQAVARTGERLWRTELQSRWLHGAPAVSPDGRAVYVSGDALGIASLDAATGAVNWMRRDFTSPWNHYVFDAEGRLVVSTRAGVFCFDATGKELWTLPEPLGRLMLVGDLLVATDRRGLRALDLETREVVWAWASGVGQTIVGLAAGDNGRIVAALQGGDLACLEPTGRLRWRRNLSPTALYRIAAVEGGETLVADANGILMLVDSNGRVISSIETRDQPYRWRPTVGPEGQVYLGHRQRLVCVGGARRPAPPPVVASDLAIVADDFVVDLWVNGWRVPLDMREMAAEIHGATSERVHVDLHEGDWIVFHVVANRLRWGGASYFGVHAAAPDGRRAFVSRVDDAWAACDDPSAVAAFLAERDAGLERQVEAPARPWHDAPRIWRDLLGEDFTGEPVWGRAPSTWIKFVVGPPPAPPPSAPPPPPPPAAPPAKDSRAYWQARLDRLETGMAPEQVRALVPSWPERDAGGLAFTGGGHVLTYRVSARWTVQIPFTGQAGGLEGTPRLLDRTALGSGDSLVCVVTEKVLEETWTTRAEIVVDARGRYAWTRYDFAHAEGPAHRSVEGRLPADVLEPLVRDFAGLDPHYDLALSGPSRPRPPGVNVLRTYLRLAHPEGP